MSREKQIEEMAEEISDVWNNKCQFVTCNGCKYSGLNDDKCQEKLIADHLIAKGYRKASDVARKIFEEIWASIATHAFTSKSEDYSNGAYDTIEWVDSKIAEVEKKYTEDKK